MYSALQHYVGMPYTKTIQARRASSITPRRLEWLWHHRIPLGKLTVIAGTPGLGKSMLTVDMAARVSTGTPFPDTQSTPNPPGTVIMFNAEDDADDTVVWRMQAAGAELNNIVFGGDVIVHDDAAGESEQYTHPVDLRENLSDIEQLTGDATGCRMLIIDPISAYLGKTDSHNEAEVRGLLRPLADMATRLHVAVVAVMHVNKAQGRSAVHRISGSGGFVAAARAAWLVGRDPDDARRRIMSPVKGNLGPDVQALAFSIVPSRYDPTQPILEWHAGTVDLSADELLSRSESYRRDNAMQQAEQWLRDALATPKDASELQQQAEEVGISRTTLQRASKRIAVRKDKLGMRRGWMWSLSADANNRD